MSVVDDHYARRLIRAYDNCSYIRQVFAEDVTNLDMTSAPFARSNYVAKNEINHI